MLWRSASPGAHISRRLLRKGTPRYSLCDEAGERAEGQVAQTLRDGIGGTVETADEAERQLIRRIGAGEREALTALFLRYRMPLFGYLIRVTKCRELAE